MGTWSGKYGKPRTRNGRGPLTNSLREQSSPMKWPRSTLSMLKRTETWVFKSVRGRHDAARLKVSRREPSNGCALWSVLTRRNAALSPGEGAAGSGRGRAVTSRKVLRSVVIDSDTSQSFLASLYLSTERYAMNTSKCSRCRGKAQRGHGVENS